MGLSAYSHIRTALFVKIEIEEYKQGDGSLAPELLLFSDHFADYELFEGETYTALGQLMAVTSSTSELSPTSNSLSIQLSGVPVSSIHEIEQSKIKSSPVKIYRAFFTQSGELIDDGSTANPIGRFSGFVNNYSLNEEWDQALRISTVTVNLDCGSTVDLLAKKSAGRKTNPTSMKRHFPNDVSFDRVPALIDANINFGGTR
jgi:hypothetical protein